MSTIGIPQHILSTLSGGEFSRLKLVFEGSSEASYVAWALSSAPVEVVIPLPNRNCCLCNKIYQQSSFKRPFVFTSRPFPFDLTDYPASSDAWSDLTSAVYQWLRQTADERECDEWRWAVNFFWICYLQGAPLFPIVSNSSVDWDPNIVPIAGEFISNRTKLLARGDYVPCGGGARFIARLVEWLQQRELWILHGVDVKEFQNRIVMNEL